MSESTLAFLCRNIQVEKTAAEWLYQFRTTVDWKRWDKTTMITSDRNCTLETFVNQYNRYLHSEFIR